MKLIEYHRAFLNNTVNLNTNRLDLLESRVESIYASLANDDDFGPKVIDYMKQGSWAHRTIIRPLANREFDADILLSIHEQDDWASDKKKYIVETLAALERSRYSGMVEKHNRCARVIYADDCHVDVVPYVELDDGRGVIVNSAANEFESSNPAGFAAWINEKDDLTSGNLRKVIRLLKYLRDFKGTFSIPSVILTALLGERVFALDADRYKDVPTALRSLLSDLDDWLQVFPILPTIRDPSCPDVDFNHRWDQDRYANFRNRIETYSAWVDDAFNEPDRDASVEKWQRVFGADFKAPAAAETVAVAEAVSELAKYERAPDEEMIQERGFRVEPTYLATIDGRVMRLAGFRHGPLRSIGTLTKGRWLEFRVTTDVPAPYEVLWKVRNFGSEAEAVRGLRGTIETGDSSHTKKERTLYSGTHWIECYVVKDGVVKATDRHVVNIR